MRRITAAFIGALLFAAGIVSVSVAEGWHRAHVTGYLSEVTVSDPAGKVRVGHTIAVDPTVAECKQAIAEFITDPEHIDATENFLERGGTIRGYCFPVENPVVTLTPGSLKHVPDQDPPAEENVPGEHRT
jgi:hypothetical protein